MSPNKPCSIYMGVSITRSLIAYSFCTQCPALECDLLVQIANANREKA